MDRCRGLCYSIALALLLCLCAMFGCGSGGEVIADSGPATGSGGEAPGRSPSQRGQRPSERRKQHDCGGASAQTVRRLPCGG